MSKRYGTLKERFWGYVSPEPNSGCWLWDGPTDDWGYGRMRVGARKVRAHRLSATLHGREIPEGLIIRHRCDMPACVNPDHLKIGTHADNAADRDERNRTARGRMLPSAKLDEKAVQEIRAATDTHRSLGGKYGVTHSVIGRIKRFEKWRHVHA